MILNKSSHKQKNVMEIITCTRNKHNICTVNTAYTKCVGKHENHLSYLTNPTEMGHGCVYPKSQNLGNCG